MKKKFLIILTAMMLLLAGCGKSDDENADSAAETGVSGEESESDADDEKDDKADKDSKDDKKSKDDKSSKDDKKSKDDNSSKDDKKSKDDKDSKEDKDSGAEDGDENSVDQVTEEPAPEYSFDVENEFFGAYVKSLEEADGGATLTIEFVNVSGQVYYKSDEEMKPGATWEKSITQPKEKWLAAAEKGTENWIHYEFYDKDSKCIFKGGVVFKTDKNIEVKDMRVFTE